jgi:hypothetical protein
MLDLDAFLTAVYVAVDDLYRERLAPAMAHRPGPKPVLSDSDVRTLAVCCAWGQWDSGRGFYRFACARLRPLFPCLVAYPEFNRRRRGLDPALAAVQRALAQRLGADLTRERLLDTVPVPVMVRKRHDDRRHRAKTLVGLVTHVQAALTAHTLGVSLNLALGRPPLALQDLVA